MYGSRFRCTLPMYGSRFRCTLPMYGSRFRCTLPMYGSLFRCTLPMYGSRYRCTLPIQCNPSAQTPYEREDGGSRDGNGGGGLAPKRLKTEGANVGGGRDPYRQGGGSGGGGDSLIHGRQLSTPQPTRGGSGAERSQYAPLPPRTEATDPGLLAQVNPKP